MICFMQYTPGGKFLNIYFKFVTSLILSPGYHTHFSLYGLIQPRKREAPLVPDLFALYVYDLRIDQNMPLVISILDGDVHHKDPTRCTNLWGRETDAARMLHSLEHIIHEFLEIRSELVGFDRLTNGQEHRFRIMNDREQ